MLNQSLTIAIISTAFVLGGCATTHPHRLLEDSSPELLNGEFVDGNPTRLSLKIGNQSYVAEGFEVRRHTDFAELYKRYRLRNPKHWERIFAGLDKSHEVYSAEPIPRAEDGSELTCCLIWKAGKGAEGICQNPVGKEYQVHFE